MRGQSHPCRCASGFAGEVVCGASGVLERCLCPGDDSGVDGGPPPDACVPQTCSDLGATCGVHDDGCGGTLHCGFCLSSHRAVPVYARDLEWDAIRSVLYASTDIFARVGGNSVVAFDPITGVPVFDVYVGDGPQRMALSDDGSSLYVVLTGEHAVRRVDLAARTAGAVYALGTARDGTALDAWDVEVVPGRASSIVVATVERYGSFTEVLVLDEGIPRRAAVGWGVYHALLEIADERTVYAYTDTTTDELRRLTIDDDGVREVGSGSELIASSSDEFTVEGGLLFSTEGDVVDPVAFRRLGRLPVAGPVVSEAATNRIYVLGEATREEHAVHAFDRTTLEEVGRIGVPTLEGSEASSLVRWGPHGLAYLEVAEATGAPTTGQLVIITSDLVAEAP